MPVRPPPWRIASISAFERVVRCDGRTGILIGLYDDAEVDPELTQAYRGRPGRD
jgi:hypothetical protein